MATLGTITDVHTAVSKLNTIFGPNSSYPVSRIRQELIELSKGDVTKLAFAIGGVIRAENALWESIKDREIE